MRVVPEKNGYSHLVAAFLSAGIAALSSSPLHAGDAQNIRLNNALERKIGSHIRGQLQRPSKNALQSDRLLNAASDQGAIPVELLLRPELLPDDVTMQLEDMGLTVRYLSSDHRWARVLLTTDSSLQALASAEWIQQANYAPEPVTRRGDARSRAGVALRSEVLAADLTVDGTGQHIGILSDSFAHTADVRDANTTPAAGESGVLRGSKPQDSGDLPASVRILFDNDRDSSNELAGSDEGAAMAELIYDIAPGAELSFHSVGSSRREFAQGIEALCNSGASVVVDDVLFLTESSYQDDLPALAASACVEQGVAYLSALGNDANKAHRFVYRDSDSGADMAGTLAVPDGSDLHNWSDNGVDRFMAIRLPAFASTYVVLNWNQPNASVNSSNGAQIDLNLYATTSPQLDALDSASTGFYASSTNTQGRTGVPFGDAVEFVLLETGANSQTFYLAIDHFDGSQGDIPQQTGVPLEFRLLYTGTTPTSIEYAFNGPSAWGHATAIGAAAVAAVPWWESPQYEPERFTTPAIDPEPFNSVGGLLSVQFDSNGNYLRSSRRTPQFAAIDGNNTTFLGSPSSSVAPIDGEPDGYPNFFGTSAAAPNAAAVFALLLEAFPNATPVQLIAATRDSAIDVAGSEASTGEDDVTGSGLMDARAAAELLSQRVDPVDNGGGDDNAGGDDNSDGGDGGFAGGIGGGSSGGGGGGGCFIATAAYGSFLAEDVELLRDFRDDVLLKFGAGREFVRLYYRYSPPLAEAIAGHEWARAVVRAGLLPLVLSIRYPITTIAMILLMIGCIAAQRRQKYLPENA